MLLVFSLYFGYQLYRTESVECIIRSNVSPCLEHIGLFSKTLFDVELAQKSWGC